MVHVFMFIARALISLKIRTNLRVLWEEEIVEDTKTVAMRKRIVEQIGAVRKLLKEGTDSVREINEGRVEVTTH